VDHNDESFEVELTQRELRTLCEQHATRTVAGPSAVLNSRASSRLLVLSGAAAMGVMGLLIYLAAPSAPAARIAAAPAPTPAATTVAAVVPARLDEVPPVRYRNPFDRSEVFEFPPGTTRAQAHDAVAALLLERARGRVHSPHLRAATLVAHGRGHGRPISASL
jgi:hypothetical protein